MSSWFANLSEKFKYFTWTPERTGSVNFTEIIRELGFQSVEISDNKVISLKNEVRHNHYCKFFENHWDYKFISTIRNPYSSLISRVDVTSFEFNEKSIEIVKRMIESNLQFPYEIEGCCQCYNVRTPDYVIRLENLYVDWLKIPFIPNHELNLSGKLKELTETKLNSRNLPNDYWKKYYDQSLADTVYYNHYDVFEKFGYDINSWKS